MGANFDMNGFRILNIPAPEAPTDPVRLEDLSALDLQVSLVNSPATTAFTTSVATIIATDFSSYTYITTQGYATPGDGGGATYKKVQFQPSHSCYWTDAGGNYWEIAEAEIDPRMFGARADVYMFSQGVISAGNLSQIIINDTTQVVGNQGFTGFVTADIGKNIVLWDYPCYHTLANTTIASLASTVVNGLTGTFSSGTKTIAMANTTGVIPYMVVSDVTNSGYIPADCIVLSVTDNTSITVSGTLLGNGTGDTLSFTIQNIANLTVAASAATTTNCNGFFGTDDTTAISTCITAAQAGLNGESAGPPPRSFYTTSSFNTATSGGHTIVFKALDMNTSRYGVSTPVYFTNNCVFKFDSNACLFALGNFSGTSLIEQSTASGGPYTSQFTLDGATLQCNGFVNFGCTPVNTNFFTIKNGFSCYNAILGGLQLGTPSSGFNCSTSDLSGKIHIEGISSSDSGYNNNPSSIGLWITNTSADNKCSGNVEIINYRTGIQIDSGDNSFTGQTHIWTNTNGGWLTQGIVLNSSGNNFDNVTIDTPWAGAGTPCSGVINNGVANNINNLDVELTSISLNNEVTAYVYNNTNYSDKGVYYTTDLGSRVNCIYTQSSSSSIRLKQVVDASLASNLLLDIGSIKSNGDVYDNGWYTQKAYGDLAVTATSNSNAAILTSIGQQIVATQSPLWYPTENSTRTPVWLDASLASNFDLNNSGTVRAWLSRLGVTKALQSSPTFRPTYSANGWTGTYQTTGNCLTFNGTSQNFQLDDILNNQTDIRIFLVMIPQTTGGGPIFSFNNRPNFGGQLRLGTSGTVLKATDNQSSGGNYITTVAGTPYLVSAIWSTTGTSGGSNGAGSVVRAYYSAAGTGTLIANSSTNSLIQTVEPVCMGGQVTSNALGATVQFTIGEMIVVTDPMSYATEEKYEGYLAWKWWSSSGGNSYVLPSDHLYYSGAPTA
jgi:hypothetical protein